ncbi:alkylation response protein AidB-like acyl-CoA dehydrogenase [Actinopolyspora biskrensis]|uniref:Alkylation response protein AidB-like acyl-CoA dehydrogenase n=1 Tax=Actinopolyspora biskrensis TaxID=1470178 RepID=A0A852YRD8_9ACTN|nr:acyl-CoA dehydrogenase family protein [Actinopolyspora biskrensis]NYH77301.1 alkylation response protein AidB-like acyl-CoA dehydrogenase [Actinopolyspora biskrensis]
MPTTSPVRQADRLCHDLLSPDEVREVRSRTREIAENSVAPAARRIANGDEKADGFPRDVFDSLADAGLFGVPFGSEVGGDGLVHPVTATAVAIEELAYFSSSIAAVFDVHCILAGNALTHGTPAQRRQWLSRVADGSVVGAFATTEPEASSDLSPQAVQTVAVQQGDTWILNGRKRWISNSPVAGFIVTLTRTGDRLSMFIVDTSLPGVRVGTPDQKMGNRGQLTADVWFEDVELTNDSLLGGEPGQGLRHALATLTLGRVGIAAAGVGMAQAAFDHAAAHLSAREAFGRKLAANQHWQFLLADRATELENARSLYLKAALRRDADDIFPEPEAAMAKYYATRLSVDMARDAVQAFGGLGFARELSADSTSGPVEAIYRDSKIGEIYEGTNEIQKWVIARNIFGKEITG